MNALLKRILAAGAVVASFGFTQTANAAAITNGSFETGDFSGWIATDLPDGTFFPLSVQTAGSAKSYNWSWSSTPTDGRYTAFSGFGGAGPGKITLAQDIGVVTGTGDTTLTFDYRAAYDLSTFCNICSNQLFDVLIQTAGGGTTLATINQLTALAGTYVDDTGSLVGSINLSSWIGQDIRVSFELDIPDNFSGPAQFQLDNVAFSANAVPEPASLLLVALGLAGLGISRRRRA